MAAVCDVCTDRPQAVSPQGIQPHPWSLASIQTLYHQACNKSSFGMVWRETFATGPDAVQPARPIKPATTKSGIREFPQPKCRFSHLHVNTVGPLPPSCSLAPNAPHSRLKQSPWDKPQLRIVPRPYIVGSAASLFQMTSPSIRALSSSPSQRDGWAHLSNVEGSPDVPLRQTWLGSSTPLGLLRHEDFTQGFDF